MTPTRLVVDLSGRHASPHSRTWRTVRSRKSRNHLSHCFASLRCDRRLVNYVLLSERQVVNKKCYHNPRVVPGHHHASLTTPPYHVSSVNNPWNLHYSNWFGAPPPSYVRNVPRCVNFRTLLRITEDSCAFLSILGFRSHKFSRGSSKTKRFSSVSKKKG